MSIRPLAGNFRLNRRLTGIVTLLWLSLGHSPLRAAEPVAPPPAPETGKLPKAAPRPLKNRSATNAPAGFRLPPGFRLELVAAEPLLASPIAMAFDERGRLFVLESPEVSPGDGAAPTVGRVRVLDEPDEAGVFQVSSVYADGLPRASALACYHGGVFVAAAPNILYLKDTQGDNRADVRSAVLTGLDSATNALGVRSLPNNLNWGLDHRIHAASGRLNGTLFSPVVAGSLADPVARPRFCV